jgi:D-sedoheptulose 7-phosphate isomerase
MGTPLLHATTGVLGGARRRRRDAGLAFLSEADALSRASREMAECFERGGRLLAWGRGLAAADARHVVVEFLHPVIVGKRALPALVIDDVHQLATIARRDDIVMTITHDAEPGPVRSVLRAASTKGALVVVLHAGRGLRAGMDADHTVRAPGADPRVVRELEMTAYHVLWELVHVFLEGSTRAGDRARGACPACADEAAVAAVIELLPDQMARVATSIGAEDVSVALVDVGIGDRVLVHAGEAIALATGAERMGTAALPAGLASLYPFLSDAGPAPASLDADVRASTEEKIREITGLRDGVLEELGNDLVACAAKLARAFRAGGTLFVFGNGGSSTDASALARLFLTPRGDDDVGLPAVALADDTATVTALANDVSFDVAYSRQLDALAARGDVAFGISTSGDSENVNRALRDARSRAVETIGLAGGGGGNMKDVGSDHFFVVPSVSVHRVQEAQATIYHVLWELTRAALR